MGSGFGSVFKYYIGLGCREVFRVGYGEIDAQCWLYLVSGGSSKVDFI